MYMWTNGFYVVIDVEVIRKLEIVAGVAIDKNVSFRNHLAAVIRVITRWMLEHVNRYYSVYLIRDVLVLCRTRTLEF